jgi:hypothetical protein
MTWLLLGATAWSGYARVEFMGQMRRKELLCWAVDVLGAGTAKFLVRAACFIGTATEQELSRLALWTGTAAFMVEE